jgi:pimeloyl-ACP methyl ester carboxylesterase
MRARELHGAEAMVHNRPMQAWSDIHYTSRDGLRLYARHYPAPGSRRRPLVCLAGLTRNSRDFHDLAVALAAGDEEGRDVYALDYRGRGRSQYDPNWRNYSIFVELQDVLDFMTLKGLHHAGVLGTSRGGILALLMAVLRPATVGAVVLNDIGPVIESDGLARIGAYVGRVPVPNDWEEAARVVRDLNQRQFPAVPDGAWSELARQYFNDENGLPSAAYDPALGKALAQMGSAIPQLWPQFAALSHVPVMTLRGENSDILSAATLEEMRRRHPHLEAVTVKGQGHAPLLKDAASIGAIAQFLARADALPAAAAA